MRVDEPFALEPAPRSEPVRWPLSPRRQVVERYLTHLRAWPSRSDRGPGQTPRRLADQAPAEVRDAAYDLAERFARARWSAHPVTENDAASANDAAASVERALTKVSKP
jgi:hypothetical protein